MEPLKRCPRCHNFGLPDDNYCPICPGGPRLEIYDPVDHWEKEYKRQSDEKVSLIYQLSDTHDWPRRIGLLTTQKSRSQVEFERWKNDPDPEATDLLREAYQEMRLMDALISISKGVYESSSMHFRTAITAIKEAESAIPTSAYALTLLCETYMASDPMARRKFYMSMMQARETLRTSKAIPDVLCRLIFKYAREEIERRHPELV